MLVLTRKTDEVICIGDDITITVVRTAHDRVRLGIDAPQSKPVHRKEIYDRIHRTAEQKAKEEREDETVNS